LLRNFFAIRNTHLDRLHGIRPNEVKTENFHAQTSDNPPEIGAVFRIAFENVLLTLASEVATNLQGDLSAEMVLKAKGQRLGLGDAALEGFLTVLDLHGIPNVGVAFAGGELDFDGVMRIREHRTAIDLRKWLQEIDPIHQDEVLRGYVSSLGDKAFIDRLPMKILRFAMTTLLGQIPGGGQIASQMASFADSFLLEKWFPGRSPRLLLDGFKTVVIREQEFVMKGAQRNAPCPCGSGKKYKRCHGVPKRS
jgi:hypothetical protein